VIHRKSPWSLRLTLLLAAALCLHLVPARAGADQSPGMGALLGVSSGLCTLAYTPVKISYAGSGLVVSGLVYLWSAGDAGRAGRLAKVVLGGDYVITPNHLKGERRLRFSGRERKKK
jgi:hypothetical protein